MNFKNELTEIILNDDISDLCKVNEILKIIENLNNNLKCIVECTCINLAAKELCLRCNQCGRFDKL